MGVIPYSRSPQTDERKTWHQFTAGTAPAQIRRQKQIVYSASVAAVGRTSTVTPCLVIPSSKWNTTTSTERCMAKGSQFGPGRASGDRNSSGLTAGQEIQRLQDAGIGPAPRAKAKAPARPRGRKPNGPRPRTTPMQDQVANLERRTAMY